MAKTKTFYGFSRAELITMAALAGVMIAILHPVMAGAAKPDNRSTLCLANQQQLARVALQQADDLGYYPTAGAFWAACAALPASAVRCPAGTGRGNDYGYNGHLAGVWQQHVATPREVIITADAAARSNNLIITPDDIAPRHGDQAVYAYADGHAALGGRQIPAFIRNAASNLLRGIIAGATAPTTMPTTEVGYNYVVDGDDHDAKVTDVTLPTGRAKAIHAHTTDVATYGINAYGAWRQAYSTARSSAYLFSYYFKCQSEGPPNAGFTEYRNQLVDGGPGASGFLDFTNTLLMHTRWEHVDMPLAYLPFDVPTAYATTMPTVPVDMSLMYNGIPLNPTGWVDPQTGEKFGVLFDPLNPALAANRAEDHARSAYYAEWRAVKTQVMGPEASWCDLGNGDDCVKSPLWYKKVPTSGGNASTRWWRPTSLSFWVNGNGRPTDVYWADLNLQYL